MPLHRGRTSDLAPDFEKNTLMEILNRPFLTIFDPLDDADRFIGRDGMAAFLPIWPMAGPAHTPMGILGAYFPILPIVEEQLDDDTDLSEIAEEAALTDEQCSSGRGRRGIPLPP